MNIVDFKLSITDNLIYVLGIGEDQKIYMWDRKKGDWKLFKEDPSP